MAGRDYVDTVVTGGFRGMFKLLVFELEILFVPNHQRMTLGMAVAASIGAKNLKYLYSASASQCRSLCLLDSARVSYSS
jgi:hypothetical protein